MKLLLDKKSGMRYRAGDDNVDLYTIKETARTYKDLPIDEDDVVIDMGAHIGGFTFRYAPLCRRIVALEPEPTNFKVLQANCKNFPNVTLYQAAVAEKTGTATLYVGGKGVWHSLITKGRKQPVKVKTIALEDLNKKYLPTVFKADIEYYEYSLPLLWHPPKRVTLIAIELHAQGRFRTLAERMHKSFLKQGFEELVPARWTPKMWHTHPVYWR